MAVQQNFFLRLWLKNTVREGLCEHCDDETLSSLRQVSHALDDVISPILFKSLYLSFRVDSFSKPGRLETFSRIGCYVRDLHFSIEHNDSAFLPDLFEPDGDTTVLPWNPPRTIKAKVDRNVRKPTESEQWMEQWPQTFQSASNAYQFIKFFEHMPRLRGLTLTSSDENSRDLYRRSSVDFAISSIRIALDKVDLRCFRRLNLDVHPGALLSLAATHSYVNSPRSGRLFSRVKKLNITMTSWDFESLPKDHLKLLDQYVRAFSPSLEKLTFAWDGGRGPCPLTLQSDQLINPEALKATQQGDHLLFGEVTTPMSPLPEVPMKPEMLFRKLRYVKLQNVALTSQQLHDFFGRHQRTLRAYNLDHVELTDGGSFEYAVGPLLNMQDKNSRWPTKISNCSQSFNDSGYESPGSHVGGTSPVEAPHLNMWTGITEGKIFDNATPGMEHLPRPRTSGSRNERPRVIITAQHEKRKVKRRRRVHPRTISSKDTTESVTPSPQKETIPSRIIFGASMLSLKSPATYAPPRLVDASNHSRNSLTSLVAPLYGAVGDIRCASLQQPLTPHPALRKTFSLEESEKSATPRVLASMRSAPILLQPTVFSAAMSELSSLEVQHSPRCASDTPMLLKPSVFDPTAHVNRSPDTPLFPDMPMAPRPTNLSTPCSSIYSPLFSGESPELGNLADILDTPTPPPLNIQRPAGPPPQSPLLSPNANPFRSETHWVEPKSLTASAIMGAFIPPPASIIGSPDQETINDAQSPPVPPKTFTKNALRAAAHLSLVTDTTRCDTAIRSGKDAIIANFTSKYSELSSQASPDSICTLSTFAPASPEGKGTLGRSNSNKLMPILTNVSTSSTTSPTDGLVHKVSFSPLEEKSGSFVNKTGNAIKKGFKAFLHRRIYGPEDEVIPVKQELQSRTSQHRQQPRKELGHGRSSSDPTHNTEARHRHPRRHHTGEEGQPPQLDVNENAATKSSATLSKQVSKSSLKRSNTSPSPKRNPSPARAPMDRPGHGIAAAYQQLQAQRMAAIEKERLGEILELEVRRGLSGVDGLSSMGENGDSDHEVIDMNEAWGPPVHHSPFYLDDEVLGNDLEIVREEEEDDEVPLFVCGDLHHG